MIDWLIDKNFKKRSRKEKKKKTYDVEGEGLEDGGGLGEEAAVPSPFLQHPLHYVVVHGRRRRRLPTTSTTTATSGGTDEWMDGVVLWINFGCDNCVYSLLPRQVPNHPPLPTLMLLFFLIKIKKKRRKIQWRCSFFLFLFFFVFRISTIYRFLVK